MNNTISTFLKIAITVVAIGAFLFGVAYTMTSSESTHYENQVNGVQSKLPVIP
ncbi:hypothetical protein QTG56_22755 (plasmid) [Rossellomorea sp. AcN35-11]|nr:hypothetical protein [Rossellomorea aquimaris]MCA1064438.1 hypothetical protein [Rossellomorea aquimaris]WJV32189.1 hypothetical protein QTG56_22745 [Rossellomorea sp. AcN35-11]WJV32191.1 hypothetical protein QTG56_22755 [Rossellomorea sp. AcN35-11]